MKSETSTVEIIHRGLIVNVAMQCIDPRSGKTGCWIFRSDNHRDPTAAISPLFPDFYELAKWCRANGWKSYGYNYVYEP